MSMGLCAEVEGLGCWASQEFRHPPPLLVPPFYGVPQPYTARSPPPATSEVGGGGDKGEVRGGGEPGGEVRGGGGVAVHTQGGADKRRSIATEGVLLCKRGCGGWPPCQPKRAVCEAKRVEARKRLAVHTQGGAHNWRFVATAGVLLF